MQLVTSDGPSVYLHLEEPSNYVVAEITARLTAIELIGEPGFTVPKRRVAVARVLSAPPMITFLNAMKCSLSDCGIPMIERNIDDGNGSHHSAYASISPRSMNWSMSSFARAAMRGSSAASFLWREHRVKDLAPLSVLRPIQLQRNRDVMTAKPKLSPLASAGHRRSHRTQTKLSYLS